MTFKRVSVPFIGAIALLSLAGCQSAPKAETTLPVGLESFPAGAAVYTLDGTPLGSTPLAQTVTQGNTALMVYHAGFVPQRLEAPQGVTSLKVVLEPTNTYLYNLLVRERVRFVRRPGLEVLMLEPANHPVEIGYAYTYFDPRRGEDLLMFVVEIGDVYVKLKTEDGASLYYPVLQL